MMEPSGGIVMSEERRSARKPVSQRERERRAEEWADREREDSREPYEQTYRDGSLKNECWRSEDR